MHVVVNKTFYTTLCRLNFLFLENLAKVQVNQKEVRLLPLSGDSSSFVVDPCGQNVPHGAGLLRHVQVSDFIFFFPPTHGRSFKVQ